MLGRSGAVVARLAPQLTATRASSLESRFTFKYARYTTDSKSVPELQYIEDDIAVYAQPTVDLMKRAKAAGFKSMINLRYLHEDGAMVTEESLAKSAGLEYSHIPFNPQSPVVSDVKKAVEKVGELPKPILVHCAGAKRAAVVALAHIAKRDKLSVDDAFKLMRKKNVDVSPTLQQLLQDLVHGNK